MTIDSQSSFIPEAIISTLQEQDDGPNLRPDIWCDDGAILSGSYLP